MKSNFNIKQVLTSGLLFLTLLFVGDRLIGMFLSKIYFQQKQGDFFQTTYALNNIKEDVVVFGSSRAMHHYDSDLLEKGLKVSTFNTGRNGQKLLYSYAVFSQLLTYHTPKTVLLDISPIEFSESEIREGEANTISSLLIYANKPEVSNIIKRISFKDYILSKIFSTYAYNSSIIQILGYYLGSRSEVRRSKGYTPLYGNKVAKNSKDVDEKHRLKNAELMETLKKFLGKAKEKGINVYVIVSPTTQSYSYSSIPEIKKITESGGYKFFNFSHLPEFNDLSLFYDNTHLNAKGATKFTEIVLKSLKL